MAMKRDEKIDENVEIEVTVDGVWNKIRKNTVAAGK